MDNQGKSIVVSVNRRECSEAGASLAYIGKKKQRGDMAEVD